MTLRMRAFIFATFLLSTLQMLLLLTSLTTNHWVNARALRDKSNDSNGLLNLGLFYGYAELDAGIGVRSHQIDVIEFVRSENDTFSFWLWLFTTLGTGIALLSSAVAAVSAVLKSASGSKKPTTMLFLLASNVSSAAGQVIAFVAWLVQFYQYLTHNVLKAEHRKKEWYSNGLASLGYSYYMVVLATIVVLINILIILYVSRHERKHRRSRDFESEEKNQGAIMLY